MLVTIDTDFPALVYLVGAAHAGIIGLPDVPAPARIALMEQILTHHGEADRRALSSPGKAAEFALHALPLDPSSLERCQMEPWCEVAVPRRDVCEGRSFTRDEFTIGEIGSDPISLFLPALD